MTTNSCILACTSILLLTLGVCHATNFSNLSPAAKKFEKRCLDARKNCVYKNIRFDSTQSAFVQTYAYKILKNQKDANAYERLITGNYRLEETRGINAPLVQRYDYKTKAWLASPTPRTCKNCGDLDVTSSKLPELIRIDFTQQLSTKADEALTIGMEVYKDQDIKIHIDVSSPSVFHPKNQHPIYIDSRIKGRHATTSFREGGIMLDLDGNAVPGSLPDYVAISPVKSWFALGSTYVEREAVLLKNTGHLPGSTAGTPQHRLDRVAHQLQSYGIRYDTSMGGVYPSVTPGRLIAARRGECKALAMLADALLRRSGFSAHLVMLSVYGSPPASFNVPDPFWVPLHVILYIPSLDLYVDPTLIAAFSANWKTSAAAYRGAIALDMTAGRFVVIH